MPWIMTHDMWTAGLRWVRSDGAVVKYSMGPRKLEWIAFEPNPSEAYLARTNGRLSWPRRWASPEAAMRAVDQEFPERLALNVHEGKS